jgi:hypothetical protein
MSRRNDLNQALGIIQGVNNPVVTYPDSPAIN